MPQHICTCCSRKLKTSHAFIKQAQDADEKLRSMYATETMDKPPLDCLQEAQIDIETCLEIKMENCDDTDIVKQTIVKCEELAENAGINITYEGPLTTGTTTMKAEKDEQIYSGNIVDEV